MHAAIEIVPEMILQKEKIELTASAGLPDLASRPLLTPGKLMVKYTIVQCHIISI